MYDIESFEQGYLQGWSDALGWARTKWAYSDKIGGQNKDKK